MTPYVPHGPMYRSIVLQFCSAIVPQINESTSNPVPASPTAIENTYSFKIFGLSDIIHTKL